MTLRKRSVALLICVLTARAAWGQLAGVGAPERILIPSQDEPGGQPVMLQGWWYRAATADPAAPAVLMLHGCGGMLDRTGRPSVRSRDYAALLNEKGWHALALDSLSPRGEKELCTQRVGTRKVTQRERRRDALAALQWLGAQPGVDAGRLALLGWSNGGSAVLSTSNQNHPDVARAPVRPRLSVAFYPGCGAEVRRGYRPVADTLMLVGLADDWTPAAPCQSLARNGSPFVRVLAYEGAYHGFDSTQPVRHRADVPNGVNPGQGVHVGGQAAARKASRQALVEALQLAFTRRSPGN